MVRTVTPKERPDCRTSTTLPARWSKDCSVPTGTRNRRYPAFAAARTFAGTSPTRPIVPSGAIVPVMSTRGLTASPRIAAMVPTVRAAPPDGPSMGHVTPSRWSALTGPPRVGGRHGGRACGGRLPLGPCALGRDVIELHGEGGVTRCRHPDGGGLDARCRSPTGTRPGPRDRKRDRRRGDMRAISPGRGTTAACRWWGNRRCRARHGCRRCPP